jgi:hypothetical protein
VLVQVLAAADAEKEPARKERRGGRRRLGDEVRRRPPDWRRDGRAEAQALRRLGDRAEH